ncbi:type I restriction endonuclease subunit M [Bdellovibrio bacteriovorus]|uniref:site-specific DNA-methyltransferase (adenine-specific) n=1 Tax=Bdellovibrio bacteriovorus TaxID=959 RepID=A0A162G0Q9_BDEBC|nr:type I restriction-modification system subunit M [Bdellovibrio bacteriovorus]KYG62975.1 type I restriction endonuclease subunit M [Bdellovibrio bacteriovorus]
MSNTKSLDQDAELKKKLWSACDTFRNVMDSNQYKDYILAFLFIKYISDIYEEKVTELRKKFKNDEDMVKRRLERERFVLHDKATFAWIFENRNKDNIGAIINSVLHEIEELNKVKLNNVFRGIDFNSEQNLGKPKDKLDRLRHLINDFKDLDLKPYLHNADVIGNAYEYLIEKFAADAGKKGGEFYTPPEVATLLAKLVEAKPGNTIYDPTCGSGSLLIKAAKEVGSNDFFIYGQEVNGATWSLARMNMFLHGIEQSDIQWGDTIKSPAFIEKDSIKKFDIVIANPPFSKDKWWGAPTEKGKETEKKAENDDYKRFWRGVPPTSRGDWAFISHMIESLLPGGTCGVVVPHGVLFRGDAEGRIRKAVIEENLIHAVVGLPPNLFYGAGISAALLIFKKNRKQKDILFIDSSKHFLEGKKQNKLRDEDIGRIFETFKKRKTIDKFSYLASLDEVQKNDFNLNIGLYIDGSEEIASIDIRAVQNDIEAIESELSQVRAKMKKYLKELEI